MHVFVRVRLGMLSCPLLVILGDFLRVILVVVALWVILLRVGRIVLLLLCGGGVPTLHGRWVSVHGSTFTNKKYLTNHLS